MPLPLKHFYMIRHGQTEANEKRIMAGNTETALTKLGRQQADKARRIIEQLEIKPAAIFHSHLSRARDTAHIINTNLNLPLFEDKNLGEKHCGIHEGAPYEACLDEFLKWIDIEGGETAKEFFQRVKTGKTNALERFNEPVLIACHGGVMRAFAALYEKESSTNFKNAHLYEFIPNPKNPSFPWIIFEYDLDESTGKIIRAKSKNYDI